ncbi:MAG TPA: hypothetical protein VKI99_18855 [Candidatus Dormibacteraeota bacterium]|nr:hypothetical protein [Candidatus Dormibacteraeota bacterium]
MTGCGLTPGTLQGRMIELTDSVYGTGATSDQSWDLRRLVDDQFWWSPWMASTSPTCGRW